MIAKEVKLVQGTPQWHAWRDAGIGSSDAARLIVKNPRKPFRKTGDKRTYDNWAMARGRALESPGRIAFIEKTGIWVRPSCWQHTEYPFLRASLDGISDANDLIVEIKCPAMKTHLDALDGTIPERYRIQINHQMLVLGHRSAIYWSFNPDHPDPNCYCAMVKVDRDDSICDLIVQRGLAWWESQKAQPESKLLLPAS